MARTLIPMSISFSKEMAVQIDERARKLGLTRSSYLRQLVIEDIQRAGDPRSRGKQTIYERVRELEIEASIRRNEIEVIKEKLSIKGNELDESFTENGALTKKKAAKPKRKLEGSTPSADVPALIDPIDHFSPSRKIHITGEEGVATKKEAAKPNGDPERANLSADDPALNDLTDKISPRRTMEI